MIKKNKVFVNIKEQFYFGGMQLFVPFSGVVLLQTGHSRGVGVWHPLPRRRLSGFPAAQSCSRRGTQRQSEATLLTETLSGRAGSWLKLEWVGCVWRFSACSQNNTSWDHCARWERRGLTAVCLSVEEEEEENKMQIFFLVYLWMQVQQ